MKKLFTLMLSLFFVAQFSVADTSEQSVSERLKPVGSVCLAGQPCADTSSVAAVDSARSGEDIYNSKCVACHSAGVAGAPILGNVDMWSPRLAQGLDTLISHAINGLNAMPPKGTCTDCSDDEIAATVEYMVEASK